MLASPVYHRVSTTRERDPFEQAVTLSSLEDQLDALLAEGQVIDPALVCSQALPDLVSSPDLFILVTIDDGYAESVLAFRDACARRGLKPLVFAPPAHVLNTEHYWWDCLAGSSMSRHEAQSNQAVLMHLPYREARRRVACPDGCPGHQLRRLTLSDLVGLGQSAAIGIHGFEHQRLDTVAVPEADRELDQAIESLREACGYLPVYAYPYGLPPKSGVYVQSLKARFGAAFTANNQVASALATATEDWAMFLPRIYAVEQPGARLLTRIRKAAQRSHL